MIKLSSIRYGIAFAILALCASIPAHAQYPGYVTNSDDTGMPSYGAFVSSSIDTVNLLNQGLIFQIPLLSRKARGFDLSASLQYESKFWVVDTSQIPIAGTGLFTTYYNWRPDTYNGLWASISNVGGGLDWTEQFYNLDPCPYYYSDPPEVLVRSNWVFISPDRSKHQLPIRKTYGVSGLAGCWSGFEPDQMVGHTDQGHVQVDITNDALIDHSAITIVAQDGTQLWGSIPQKDTNGNYGNTSQDTLGRTLYTTAGTGVTGETAYQYYDSGGTLRTILVDSESLSITTAFPTTSYDSYHLVNQYSGALWVISKITLPNGLSYTFSYDDPANPGHPNPFGEPTKVTLPTGGYIKYKWSTIATLDPGPTTQNPLYSVNLDSRVLVEKDVSEDGTTERVWTYGMTGAGMTVTDPLGNKEIHNSFSSGSCTPTGTAPGGSTLFAPVIPVDPGVEYMDASSHVLKIVAYDYCSDVGPLYSAQTGADLDPDNYYTYGYRNTRIIRTTVTLPDTGQVSKTETDFTDCYTYTVTGDSTTYTDCRENPTETREYDYGSGAPGSLIRKTDTSYWHTSHSTYLSGHIWNRVYEKDVYDGPTSALMASTQYNYDSTSITATSGVPQHDYTNYPYTNTLRGNVTEIKRLLTSTSTWLTTTNYYNDVGNLIQTTDPGGHTYTLSYTDNFTDGTNRNSQGFLTSVTGPTTSGYNHIEGKQYFWNTGLTAAVCGQNAPSPSSCVNTYSPSSGSPVADYAKYSYDALGRPSTVTHGDGGTTSFSFTEPATPTTSSRITVSSTSAIDTSTNLTNSVVIDGLGRVIQTQLTSDPQGADYVDTVYDEVGRVSTASNPHRSASSSTDGITTNVYDGLGRAVKVIPPDGTTSANNVQTYYHGNSITAVDQTGKARRSYTDALGRLIEVDETAVGSALPGVAAVAGTGIVTISGAEQEAGHEAIIDYVCTAYDDSGDCLHWDPEYGYVVDAYDSGTVTLVANGHTDSVTYGVGSSAPSIATALNAAINADSGAYVTSSLSGTTLTITAKTTGSGTDYAFGVSTTWDTGDFSSPSYSGSSGGDLADGADGVPSFPPAETPAAPYVTLYTYDALNNLICVEQHGNASGTGCSSSPSSDATSAWRVRRFVYDSLDRLVSSKNPESGTTSYTYDSDGNVLTKTDARGIVTSMAYDELHRLNSKSYSDGTPTANFYYDSSGWWGMTQTNTLGRLMEEWTGTGITAEIYSYDARGRVSFKEPYVPNPNWFPATYTYNYVGGMTSYTNGISTTFNQSFDAAGRVTQVTSSYVDATHPATLATINSFTPAGAVSQMTYGNGLVETSAYNNRLQPTQLRTYNTTTSTDILNLTYGFTDMSGANNGNIVTFDSSATQIFMRSYTYDELNRLSTMSSPSDASGCYGLSWTYDAWANRLSQNTTSGSCYSPSHAVLPNNRITETGYTYDAAGNMTSDVSHSYSYDAENRLIQVDGGATATYTYDADGHRVMKTTSAGTTDYVYDLAGNVISEYEIITGYTGWSAGYVYLSGQMVAEYNGGTFFVHKDHLGSTRVMTKLDGTVYDSMDYLPFGEQIAGSSGSTHKFTGKERDAESGLDNFEARYMSSSLGRFMSPDEYKYVNKADPQTWNLYGYVANNPINSVDPTGHAPEYMMPHEPYMHPQGDGGPTAIGPQSGTSTEAEEIDASDVVDDTTTRGSGQLIINIKLNVLYEKADNLTATDKKGFTDTILKSTEDLFGQIDIRFDVTFKDADIQRWRDSGQIRNIQDAVKNAINVIVKTNLSVVENGASGEYGSSVKAANGYLLTFIGVRGAPSWILSHELAHHLMGDTKGTGGLLKNMWADMRNNHMLRNITDPGYSQKFRDGAKTLF